MKTLANFGLLLAALLISGSILGQGGGPGPQQDVGELSEAEQATLIFMREEEKLARDSYLTLHDLWGKLVFANIALSEQRHMDAMKNMLDLYGATDPVADEADIGTYANNTLQDLYDGLMQRGDDSLLEAYHVGAYIEEQDIFDLRAAILGTDEEPLESAYENLLAGARNHLRAFVAHIVAGGVDYEAQILDQTDVDEIVGTYSEIPPPNEAFTINANLTDAWYYPGTTGQGFFISVFPDQRQIFVGWFTYDSKLPADGVTAEIGDAGQRWLTAQGSYAGNQAELQVYSFSGGLFDEAPPQPEYDLVGSMLLQFDNCGSGVVTYDLRTSVATKKTGIIPIERVAADNVTNCQRNNQPPAD